ncbi:hydrogenase maturation protease [Desulfonatronospira thiodismutans ASO3-1]|uniref:Hydrogenase maturation protease n=1 Tax=Desulfonatronospira thiodismutans ASO3-1 TaxID=555779 RepID=D6SSI5_9BACT|nr:MULTISPECIES: hydrogenase maturation protease [Desulfonatronospira]EFI33651.1 hydrogenase maturation protease [Desulfonatronospira thiodismutans ASO3-1]
MKKSIVCIGSIWITEDMAGLQVYKRLQDTEHPRTVEVFFGGLSGLNLLPFLEQGGRVVFVDNVKGFAAPGRVVVLDQSQVIASRELRHYGHGAGLPFLLTVLPEVCTGTMPREIFLVGIEEKFTSESVQEAACLSLQIAENGRCCHGKEL